MSVAHLPGCDLNHKPRQRCSTADLGFAISTQSTAIGVHGQIVSSRQKLGCFAALLLPLLAVVLGGAALLFVVFITWGSPPELPDFARPIGANELVNVDSCGGSGDDWSWSSSDCREITFGSYRSFAEIEPELEAVFHNAGWSTSKGIPGLNGLQARHPDGGRCIYYFPGPPRGALTEYAVLIKVRIISSCS